MQVRELIELLRNEPQTATVTVQSSEGNIWWVEGVLDFNANTDELILEIE